MSFFPKSSSCKIYKIDSCLYYLVGLLSHVITSKFGQVFCLFLPLYFQGIDLCLSKEHRAPSSFSNPKDFNSRNFLTGKK